jgi:hypothetical protein
MTDDSSSPAMGDGIVRSGAAWKVDGKAVWQAKGEVRFADIIA